ncbi:alpha/beta fold hydrolase [Nocardioides massiliensis]|uniref:Pimeloyl-ACP methyl ester carboxylesterase n=1 Tax=Nocardioides massiliensis TaxID=1325935 RepID=A0ABT9NP27_9ACTN|nr:alpha/beta fold hydrolase [Nocardioides massiliensis]MDP9821835.1 pimeloyl-ACP methyl ester carboxylesterase [Nocardioides massiliensis]
MMKGYAPSRFGQLHYVEVGSGRPVLLLHQTPRSWDEFRDVIPLLAGHCRAIAMDTVGFGASARVDEPFSIELFADGVADLLTALDLEDVLLVGHHTGGVVAMEVAARGDRRVTGLALSGVPWVDQPRRERVASAPPIDHVDPSPDGAHVGQLWARRRDFYPADRPDLLDRLTRDALAVLDRVEEGHQAVNRYRMEDRAGLVTVPTLVLCGAEDAYSLPDVPALVAALTATPAVRTDVLDDTGVPSADHRPDLFAAALIAELEAQGAR